MAAFMVEIYEFVVQVLVKENWNLSLVSNFTASLTAIPTIDYKNLCRNLNFFGAKFLHFMDLCMYQYIEGFWWKMT